MSGPWQGERLRPLVALVWSLPLVAAALEEAIDFADVRTFSADHGDIADLLRRLRPDAVVVDEVGAAASAAVYASESGLPVLHLSVREQMLRVLGPDGWADASDGADPGPGTVRNVLAGALFAGGVAER